MTAERLAAPPVVVPLDPGLVPAAAFQKMMGMPYVLWVDSSRTHATLGRYSFLMADPVEVIQADPHQVEACVERLESALGNFSCEPAEGIPPFQGGAAGYLSYDLNRHFERVPEAKHDEFRLPILSMGIYDCIAAWDHQQNRAWIISTGYPERDPVRRKQRAQDRADGLLARLRHEKMERPGEAARPAISPTELAPCFACPQQPGVMSNFARDAYLEAVRKAVDYIHAGDIFQVNLAQRLITEAKSTAEELYLKLRRRNPAPFGAFYDFGIGQIVSASPERFIQVTGREIETRPIKGTRRRSGRPALDMYFADDLLNSEKDRAENVMIVDLLRNDLARICEPESIQVTGLCNLEVYETVQHLVSTVVGRLRPDVDVRAILQAIFPGGSITGAPKIRAMEIISELEPTARGPYCGSLGYISFSGNMDWNILIRTIVACHGWWQFSVGGGIVADSDPLQEYEETWHKALGLLHAVRDE